MEFKSTLIISVTLGKSLDLPKLPHLNIRNNSTSLAWFIVRTK